MEGGVPIVDGSAFKDCLSLSRKNPYVLRLAFSAGIGGFLFGYDTGVISGAILYIRQDFNDVDKKIWLQGAIVSMALAGAIIGASIGGWMSDRFGRKVAILYADAFFFSGAVVMAAAPNSAVLVAGRLLLGFGVGMASMTAPLYISEASPTRVRGALVGLNSFLITGGQFISYLINLGFTNVKGTWRWMLGIAAVPAGLQLVLMLMLPESPRWQFRKGNQEEGIRILRKIYPEGEVEAEIQHLRELVDQEVKEEEAAGKVSLVRMLKITSVRRGLYAGMGLQIFQQFVGINTVMYYSPTIVQLAGFASNKIAMLLSLITAGLNAFGSILSIYLIEKAGRKKLLLVSLVGVMGSLILLTVSFHQTKISSPSIDPTDTTGFNGTCLAYTKATNRDQWDCMSCLHTHEQCAYCAAAPDKLKPGACWNYDDNSGGHCASQQRDWYTKGCPSKTGFVAIIGLGLYILFFSPGMGTVPWVINSEIYPLRFRGVCGGMASTAVWVSNLIVSQSFLSVTEAIGTSYTFMIFGIISFVAIFYVLIFVPETKGVPMEDIEKMLNERSPSIKFWQNPFK